ncbi:hypothetical protein [Mumia zhuanghuii]|uniref:Ig-like domain-containing protein n=1 Tax=Mumia zhuanghuii TaxID=2585211 RepID=A0A5C4MGB0_9ACTN|nr:hypothetical protein [Mumia zhuanghuii]TNC42301.1 hypothetical protein FHE65_21390 [Mumia zhuanghuii]TNC42538.1 hypothetical protein FHE65_20575 [Mumia zhuanghuii]
MRNTPVRTLASATAVSVVTVGAVTVLASPASADDYRCKTTAKEFPTNGYNADVKVELCLVRSWGGTGGGSEIKRAYAKVSWGESGAGKWEKFAVQVRIEQNDSVVRSKTCEVTNINTTTGSYTCSLGPDTGISGNTADGTVTYNVNDDGLGNQSWGLTGTPKL